MNVEAEKSVRDILDSYGQSICDTPRMFETLLKQEGKASPNEVDALVAAVRHNVVKRLLNEGKPDVRALTQRLTLQGQQAPLVAKWAVETWAKVLSDRPPQQEKVTSWNDVETPPGVGGASSSIATKALIGLALVAFTGAIGGAAPGVWIGSRLAARDPQAQHVVSTMGMKDIGDGKQFMLIYGTLGGLAGLVGAGVGWMFGGHTQMTVGRVMGAMLGALQAGANGAYYGMANGEGAGTFIGCLFLSGIGTYIATRLGVLVVLAFLGQLSYLILAL